MARTSAAMAMRAKKKSEDEKDRMGSRVILIEAHSSMILKGDGSLNACGELRADGYTERGESRLESRGH